VSSTWDVSGAEPPEALASKTFSHNHFPDRTGPARRVPFNRVSAWDSNTGSDPGRERRGEMGRRSMTLAALAALGTGGCVLPVDIDFDGGTHVRGSGHPVSLARSLPPYDAIIVAGPVRVLVERTGEEYVELTAEDNLVDYLEMEVRGGVLYLGVEPGVSVSPRREILYRVWSYEVLELDASGASSVDIEVGHVPTLWVTVSGASRVAPWGDADQQDLFVSGASRYDAFDLHSHEVRADVSGASLVDVRVSEVLDVAASGASRVRYLGWPEVVGDVSGGSTVTRY
jgi:hypothetical protein